MSIKAGNPVVPLCADGMRAEAEVRTARRGPPAGDEFRPHGRSIPPYDETSGRETMMARLRAHNIAMSLDGYMAGPDQSTDTPLGVGGERLHDWVVATRSWRAAHGMEGGVGGVDDDFAARAEEGIGATIMGRNMFGPVRGRWPDEEWRGWWGEDPPFHHPVFVLTHHARPPLTMAGGTTFHFVTDGIESALTQATAAAHGKDVRLGGGAATIRAYLRAGLLDELHVAVVPILLGTGERPFPEAPTSYTCTTHTSSPAVTHCVLTRNPG